MCLVEEREWWYRAEFRVEHKPQPPDERLLLVFHGLDTFVTIWFNGVQLGQHANLFRAAVFDATDLVRNDQMNNLALCFEPPLTHVQNQPPLTWHADNLKETKRNLMRKAQFGFGWDWGPRLPTIGIWRPVELLYQPRAAIQGVKFATLEIEPERDQALVSVSVDVEHFASESPIRAEISLRPPHSGKVVKIEIASWLVHRDTVETQA